MKSRLIAFAKIKLHRPSWIVRSAIHQGMTHLMFVGEVGKLGGVNFGKYEATYPLANMGAEGMVMVGLRV